MSNVGMATEPAPPPQPPRAPHCRQHPASQHSQPPPSPAGTPRLAPGSSSKPTPQRPMQEKASLVLHRGSGPSSSPASTRQDPSGSLRPRRGPCGPRTARSRGMFSLSSPAGLDTLLFSHCFSRERLFITADPWGKSFSLSLSCFYSLDRGKRKFSLISISLPTGRGESGSPGPCLHPSIAPTPRGLPTAARRHGLHRRQRARRRAPENAQARTRLGLFRKPRCPCDIPAC